LGIAHPVFQAPMAGGGDTPALVSAVSEAGALGFIGAAYLSPDNIIEAGRAVRARTQKPFGVNLFAPVPAPPEIDRVQEAIDTVAPFFAAMGLPLPRRPSLPAHSFQDQFAAALDTGASVFSFTFGSLPPDMVAEARDRRLVVAGTATTVDEAVALEKAGVDAVVLQGSEAGGHRGTFAAPFEAGLVGTIALVPQAADAVSIPVVASGGIMDGRGIAAALALGASAVQMGSAFLMCDESGIGDAYRLAVLQAREDQTRVTRAFSGRPARGIANRFMDAVDASPDAILPFPYQNALTRPLRTAGAQQGRADVLSLWAGQGLRLARRQRAADLVARLAAETDAAIERLTQGAHA
jgi:nitronate monooxygenase